jgi:hypothetical protein
MTKPPPKGDNFRLIGKVAEQFVTDLEKQVETVKRKGTRHDKPKAKNKG